MIKQVGLLCLVVFLQKLLLPAPVQQGFLERRRAGEENGSELIMLGTDPEKRKVKNK